MSSNSHLLARLVRDAAGGHAADVLRFARRELFAPLGMRHVTLELDATGTPIGPVFMFAPARDWARFGLLFLDDGVVGGKRILPEGWVRYSAEPTPRAPYGYGAHWWTNLGNSQGARTRTAWGMPPDSFFASGSLGQYVVVVPSERLVVTRFGVTHDPALATPDRPARGRHHCGPARQGRTLMIDLPGGVMETVEEATARMATTADDFAAASAGSAESDLSRRPDPKNWSAKEIVCHIRDVEELFMDRIKLILATDGARFAPVDPDPWVAMRQYQRNNVQEALASFRGLREETLAILRRLTPEQWERGGTHITRGPLKIADVVLHAARHDDNHLDQLKRALKGQA